MAATVRSRSDIEQADCVLIAGTNVT